jgi:hypothetical protein
VFVRAKKLFDGPPNHELFAVERASAGALAG